jgi:hypothetical protein
MVSFLLQENIDELQHLIIYFTSVIKMGMYTPMTFLHYNNQSTKR